ncbi:hypothetical protein [Cellulomonas sp. P24]|uniref:hypothetical protein n=1 Tax=Cellulomonas sp. P24 TaxID=2885206 RepID=UPI00216B0427|nr:hypothetical protein [Cellulomonas sp. P24]MCR6493768.1 hypothetical protein [Cellulomonas sp. P24]
MGFSWLDPSVLATDAYVEALVDATVSLVSEGTEVVVFGGDAADDPVIEATAAGARARLPEEDRRHVLVSAARSLTDQMSELATADVVASSRFHNVVATFLTERPVVAVADRAKVRRLMAAAGLQGLRRRGAEPDGRRAAARRRAGAADRLVEPPRGEART